MTSLQENTHTPGTYGATQARWRGKTDIWATLLQIFNENKHAGEAEVARRMGQALLRDADLCEEAGAYIVRNAWSALMKGERTEPPPASINVTTNVTHPREPRPYTPRVKDPKAEQEHQAKVDRAIEAIKNIVLMDQVLSNGKRRGDCTAEELIKAGSNDAKLGRRLKKDHGSRKLLRNAYGEADVRKMFGIK